MQNTKTGTAKRLRWGVMALGFGVALFWAASAAERFIIAARFTDTRVADVPAAAAPAGPHAGLKSAAPAAPEV